MNLPTVRVIIQARMNSKRLPGKSMSLLNGLPAIGHLIAAVQKTFSNTSIWIATSKNFVDDPIAEFGKQLGLKVFRGNESNVAERFFSIAKAGEESFILRLCGDSPAMDPHILHQLVNGATDDEDLITTIGGNYPSGMNAELIKKEVFLKAYPKFSVSSHFEHVTEYFYEYAESFKIKRIESGVSEADRYKFSIDTNDDFRRVSEFFSVLERPHFEYSFVEKCKIYKRLFL